jgi:hypothetical protein
VQTAHQLGKATVRVVQHVVLRFDTEGKVSFLSAAEGLSLEGGEAVPSSALPMGAFRYLYLNKKLFPSGSEPAEKMLAASVCVWPLNAPLLWTTAPGV